MHHIDLFSGIGGFALALHGVSKPCLYCDIDPYVKSVLSKNMEKGLLPRAPLVSDIRDITLHSIPSTCKPKLICSSFPCVGFSSFGHKRGFDEPQTKLFYEMLRVVDVFGTPMVFLENVAKILVKGMDTVVHEFARRQYELRWVVVPAHAVGLPHNRERWFCLCIKQGYRPPRALLEISNVQFKMPTDVPARLVAQRGLHDLKALHALGNALVPGCARLAFVLLITSKPHTEKPVVKGKWPKCGLYSNMHVVISNECPKYVKPDIGLQLVGRKAPAVISPKRRLPMLSSVRQCLWSTPRASSLWPSRILTRRTARDLATQLSFEKHTPAKLRNGYVNVKWVERLMGFPQGWL